MILFVGPPGSGKSVQGQLLAARHDWRWMSAGQLLRDTHDTELLKSMGMGEFIDDKFVNKVIADALHRSRDVEHIIMDGYPRHIDQAKWLVGELPRHERQIQVVVKLKVSAAEIARRLKIRGRLDDTPAVVSRRMKDYHQETEPVLDYYKSIGIQVKEVDGEGTVGTVHDRIQGVIEQCLLV
jgi:adenylate kinase